jgi:hypothetical protein
MAFNQAEAYRHAMCMELQHDKFRFSIIEIATKKSVMDKSFTLLSFNKAELVKVLDDDIFKFDFKSTSLTVSTNRQTLVPISIFNTSKPKEIFGLNHQAPFDNIDYNRIPELGIASIYELPIWIKSVFVIKMPRVKIIHTSTTLLKGIFNQPVFKGKIHVFWQNNSFYLAITSKGKLQYFNLFQSNQISDLVYHLLFVLEQKELELKEMNLHMYGVSDDWEKLTEISKLLNYKVEVSSDHEKSMNFILTSQLLCV